MHISFLLTGCTAALYESQLRGFLHRLSTRYWLAVAGILIICVGLVPYPIETYVKTVIYPLGIALLVLRTPVQIPLVRAFFHHPMCVYLGKISYTVYLWQQLATAPWIGLSPWVTALFVTAVWLLAHLSWQYIELPLIRIATHWSDAIKRTNSATNQVKVK